MKIIAALTEPDAIGKYLRLLLLAIAAGVTTFLLRMPTFDKSRYEAGVG